MSATSPLPSRGHLGMARHSAAPRPRRRLELELLEDRCLPSIGAGGLYNSGEWLSADPVVQGFYAGLVDPATGRAYFGGSHGSGATLDLNGALPTLVSSVDSGSYGGFGSGAIDTRGATHYLDVVQRAAHAISQYSVGTVSSPTVPQATGLSVPIPDNGFLSSAVADLSAGYAYFCGMAVNGGSLQNYVVQLNLSTFATKVEWLQGIPSAENVDCAIDPVNHYLYLSAGLAFYPFLEQVNIGSFTDGATVGTYFDLGTALTRSAANFIGNTQQGSNVISNVTNIGQLMAGEWITTGPFAVNTLITAVDAVNDRVTVSTTNNQGASSTGNGVTLTARLMPSIGGMTLEFDQSHNRLYLGTYTYDPNVANNPNDPANSIWPFNQATIVQVDPTGGGSGFANAVIHTLDLQPGERDLSTAVFDPVNGDFIASTDNTFPGHVYRVHVGDGTIPMTEIGSIALNDGSVTPTEMDGVDDAVNRTPQRFGEVYTRSAFLFNGYAYFGTDTDGAQVVKIALTNPAASLTSIRITPANFTAAPGATVQFIATGTFSDGTTAYVTGGVGGTTVSSWTSSNGSVAAPVAFPVNTGLFTTSGTSSVTVTETIGSVLGNTSLIVGSPSPPTVTPNTANLDQNATTLLITGTGFDPTATNDAVALSSGNGTVAAATATQLTVSLTGAPALGPLSATVTSDGNSSSSVQVATLIPGPALGTLTQTQWTVNQPGYQGAIALSGGTGAYSNLVVLGLPPGISATLAGSSVNLTGTPTTAGTFTNIQVSVQDAGGGAAQGTFTLMINPGSSGSGPAPGTGNPAPGGSAGGSGAGSGRSPAPGPVYYAAGAGAGGGPQVAVYNAATGVQVVRFNAFAASFTGGVRVAVGDVNGDGVPDIICGAGAGGGPEVAVYDGKTFQRIMDFLALPAHFTGGVFVAAGDVDGDGCADIITAADAGGGPQVTITSGKTGALITSFYATASTFTGGIRVAAADLNGDGFCDVIAAAGPGGGPQVTIFDGKSLKLLTAFYALPSTFTGGMYIAAGDVNGDGKADIIVGAEKGGGPEVNVFTGASIAGGVTPQSLYAFYALPPQFTGGVRVGYSSAFEGRRSILSVAGPGGGPQTTVFDGLTQAELDSFYAFPPTFGGGVYVGGN